MPIFHLTTTTTNTTTTTEIDRNALEEALEFLGKNKSFKKIDDNKVFLDDYPLEWKEFTKKYESSIDLNLFPDIFGINYFNEACLFVFDLDSTLIQMECIDELARMANKHLECSSITERAMNGELDFKESLLKRIMLLKGLNAESSFKKIISSLPITKGVKEFISTIRKKIPKSKMFICSGGFVPIAEEVSKILGMDGSFSNELEIIDGLFTGTLVNKDHIVDANFKRNKLVSLREHYSIPFDRVIAIGDGSNDLKMITEANLCGIAFCAKEVVRRQSKIVLNSGNFEDLLHIMGIL